MTEALAWLALLVSFVGLLVLGGAVFEAAHALWPEIEKYQKAKDRWAEIVRGDAK